MQDSEAARTFDRKPAVRALARLLENPEDYRSVATLFDYCRDHAERYLRAKRANGRLNPHFFGLSVEDLAIDCSASLFERDESGRFVQLETYFGRTDGHTESAPELEDLRRLLISAVERQLFYSYRRCDPALSRWIRNLKSAVQDCHTCRLRREYGTVWITWETDEQTGKSTQVVSREEVALWLRPMLRERVTAPEVLTAVEGKITGQTYYRRALPVTRIATVVRSGLREMHREALSTERSSGGSHYDLRRDEIRSMLQSALERVRREKHASYVRSGKMSEELYRCYMGTVSDILEGEFLTDEERWYYDYFSARNPVAKSEYRTFFRTKLEYLTRLVRAEFLEEARNELAD